MRILNNETNKKLDDASIFLTKEEIIQLRGYLNQLLENSKSDHFHLSSDDYQKEITICLYGDENLDKFDARSRKLILEDE